MNMYNWVTLMVAISAVVGVLGAVGIYEGFATNDPLLENVSVDNVFTGDNVVEENEGGVFGRQQTESKGFLEKIKQYVFGLVYLTEIAFGTHDVNDDRTATGFFILFLYPLMLMMYAFFVIETIRGFKTA